MNTLIENDKLFPDLPKELKKGYPSKEHLAKLRTTRCVLPVSALISAVERATEVTASDSGGINRLDCMVDCPTQIIISYDPDAKHVPYNGGGYNVISAFYLLVIKGGKTYNLSKVYSSDELLLVFNTARRNVTRLQERPNGGEPDIDILVEAVPTFNL